VTQTFLPPWEVVVVHVPAKIVAPVISCRVMDYRVGFGYDIHPLKEKRSLIVGGVDIPSELGTIAHSDGDVLVHAIIDALLGAIASGNIGMHFPDTDPQNRGRESISMLREVVLLLEKEGFRINNMDSTIVLESPRLAPYIEKMKQRLSEVLKIEGDRINIKPKRGEGLGDVGRGKAIEAYAVVIVYKDNR